MSDLTESPAPAPAPVERAGGIARPAVSVAAITSAVAGLIHAAAAGNHQGDSTLVWMFAACAAAQLGWGWAVAVSARPSRSLLVTGLVINGGAVFVWALSRTTGIGFIDSLSVRESVGAQDFGAAFYAAASCVATVCILVRPKVRAAYPPNWTAAVAACAFLLALPALVAGHTHAGLAHDHVATGSDASAVDHSGHSVTGGGAAAAAGHDHTTTDEVASESDSTVHDHSGTGSSGSSSSSAHDHSGASSTDGSDGSDGEAVHDHSSGDGGGTTDTTTHDHSTTTTTPVDNSPIISLDDPRLTPDQVQRANDLIAATYGTGDMFLTEEDVINLGYQPIGDGTQPGEYEHFINWSYLSDGFTLDAPHVESIVMKINADGTKRVVAAMYALSWGDTIDDVPDIAGALTVWHDHDNLCFVGDAFAGLAVNGVCNAGTLRDSPPMLHVWLEENPCGPFAIIDNEVHVCDGSGHHH